MVYLIEYTYTEQQADRSFHFVKSESIEKAILQAKEYIADLLYYRFSNHTEFELVKIEEVKEV
ncbi:MULTISPECIES: hypothetical protein [unclassified Mannheimia]|uniref:hypothetical protein n=2 Tax=Mannheimia TaxID=75984 RepID=UPI00359D4D3B